MALQVWLPLTKDLRQQGIADTSTIALASGNTFIDGGKLGNKALHLTKQQTILGTSSCMSGKKQMSYAFWVKVNTAWSAQWLDGIAWYSTDGSSIAYSRQEFYTNCTRIGTWFSGSSLSGYIFTPGEWTHIVGTFDYTTGIAKFYINGVLQGTSTSLSKTHYCRGDFYLGDSGVDIVENDVRIYDHCLSPMEVKKLSQGLVLHYPLNDKYIEATTNLNSSGLIGQNTCFNQITGTYNYGSSTDMYITNGIFQGYQCSKVYMGTNGNDCFPFVYLNSTITPAANETKAISFDYYPTIMDNIVFYTYSAGSAGEGVWRSNNQSGTWTGTRCTIPVKLNKWNHIEFVVTNTTGTSTSGWGYIQIGTVKHTSNTSNYWLFKNVQWENKDHATPFVLGSRNGENVVYDCSGFYNNGTTVGNLITNNNTPKYQVSTKFNGTEAIIIPFTCGSISEAVTVACWGYESNWNVSTAERLLGAATNSSGWCIGDYGSENTLFAFYVNGSYNTATGFKQLSAGWHHFVITFDGLNLIYYVDGQEFSKKTFSTKQIVTGTNNINIGRHVRGNCYFKGSMSDVRIYATALSADDVKSLYQNCATIDADGTIHGQIRS